MAVRPFAPKVLDPKGLGLQSFGSFCSSENTGLAEPAPWHGPERRRPLSGRRQVRFGFFRPQPLYLHRTEVGDGNERSGKMIDTVSAERRSEIMSRIRGKDTQPEMRVRRMVHAMGYRYRLHRKDLPGRPDMTFPRLQSRRASPQMSNSGRVDLCLESLLHNCGSAFSRNAPGRFLHIGNDVCLPRTLIRGSGITERMVRIIAALWIKVVIGTFENATLPRATCSGSIDSHFSDGRSSPDPLCRWVAPPPRFRLNDRFSVCDFGS